jgi:hypothetical protein
MRFAGVFTLREETVAADVVDDEGEVTTRMACELLQWRRLPSGGVAGPASVTAFGLDVGVYADPDAYLASPASLLTPERADEPPPDDLGEGIAWPPRMDAQSFLSYGIFGEPAEAQPHARLAGVVTAATTHRVALTGQDFHAVRLLSLGLSFDLCLAATDHDLPGPGQVVAGTVLLVASMDALWEAGPSTATRRRRWWRRG